MRPRTQKLFSIASAPLGPPVDAAACENVLRHIPVDVSAALIKDIAQLLAAKNGFYAFESALHFFPVTTTEMMDISRWNSPTLWRDAYGEMAVGFLFFAEDLFGGQFWARGNELGSFDPETGNAETLATNLEQWCKVLLGDYEVLTGYPLAHEWQIEHGKLQPGQRLVPKRPFVLQGAYELENLAPCDASAALKKRAKLAKQLYNLPDGATIRWPLAD